MPKVIVNTCYIKNNSHFLNYLEYAGEKIEAQSVTLNSGETINVAADDFIELTQNIEKINVTFKDGKTVSMSPERYTMFTTAKKQEYITSDLMDSGGTVQKENMDTLKYIDYIAHRPSVEKIEGVGHGLFDINGAVNINEAKECAEQYKERIKWSHIVSLTRVDAERTGYDNRKAWENLIRAKAPEIAKAYNISLENLILNCAFHNKDDHPHIHLFIYSKNSREAFITGGKEGLINSTEKMKSIFFNEIFKEDISYLKEIKNDQENALEKKLKEITRQITNRKYIPSHELLNKLHDLSEELEIVDGKKYYGYLPKPIKKQVNDILKYAVLNDKFLNQAYTEYMKTYRTFIEQYIDDEEKIEKKLTSISDKLFNPVSKTDSKTMQNIIIKSALQYNQVIKKKAEDNKLKKKSVNQSKDKNHDIFKAAEKYTGDENFKELDNKDNVLLAEFKKQLQKSLRCVYTDKNKDFAFKWQKKLSDAAHQLQAFEFQTFDKLSIQSRHDVLQIVKDLIKKDDELKKSFDTLIEGHKKLFEKFDNPEKLLDSFKEYLFNDGQYTASSIANTVILFSCNEDIKYCEWQNLNKYNKDVSKQLLKSLNNCYSSSGEISLNIQQKINEIKHLLDNNEVDIGDLQKLQSELLHYIIDNDKDFALEYECMMNEQKNVLHEHCFDVGQYKKEYMTELEKLFFKPGKYGYQKLHYLIERFSENSDSYKFNQRIKQCKTYKDFNKEMFKSLNKSFDYTSNLYSVDFQRKLYNLHMRIEKLKAEKQNGFEDIKNDVLKQSKMDAGFQFRYSDLDSQAKQEIKSIIKDVMNNNPEVNELYNQLKAEYNNVVNSKLFYGENNVEALMNDFELRFFNPDIYDTKTNHNIIFKYAESFERNKIISEHYANNNNLRLEREYQYRVKKIQAKQQRLLQFAVKSMLYGLCHVFTESAMNNNMYSKQSNRNITLQSMGGRFQRNRPNKYQNISHPIQF